MELEGKVALITGSTGDGMGRSTALTLAMHGADIVLNHGTFHTEAETGRNAEKVAQAIEDMGRRVIVARADTRKDDEVAAMVEKAGNEFGRIDILVNNASSAWDPRDYTEISHEHWQEVLAAQIDGAFLTMKYIVPGMRERGWGRIIHIALSGVLGMESMNRLAPDYCLGKAARAWMTTAFGLQEFKKGITANCIEPGPTDHMAFDDALEAARGDGAKWQRRKKAAAHDVAEIILFLCSEAGRFISGSHIRLPT